MGRKRILGHVDRHEAFDPCGLKRAAAALVEEGVVNVVPVYAIADFTGEILEW